MVFGYTVKEIIENTMVFAVRPSKTIEIQLKYNEKYEKLTKIIENTRKYTKRQPKPFEIQ